MEKRVPVSRPSQLSHLIRNVRLRAGLTQAEFAKELGLETLQYMSKLETGRVTLPSRDFLEAFSARSGESVEHLIKLSGLASPGAAGAEPADDGELAAPLRLVFGHCLWGAPIFLAAHRGMLPQFQVASYALLGDRGGSHARPSWIVPDDLTAVTPGPGPGSDRARSWSAVKILDLLEKEEIELGAVPGNIIWGRGAHQRFMRIGTIVDSATGCTFLGSARHFPPTNGTLSTRDLFNQILDYVERNDANVRVAVEAGTVADNYLHSACQRAAELAQAPALSKTTRRALERLTPDRLRWHCENSAFATSSYGELQEQCAASEHADLLGVITWEPHATWLEQQADANGVLCRFPLHFSPDQRGRLALVSFDLVMLRTSGLSRAMRLALAKLMQKLWQNAALLSELEGTSFDREYLGRIAYYFGLPHSSQGAERTREHFASTLTAIQSIRYSVHWAMESQSVIGMLQPN